MSADAAPVSVPLQASAARRKRTALCLHVHWRGEGNNWALRGGERTVSDGRNAGLASMPATLCVGRTKVDEEQFAARGERLKLRLGSQFVHHGRRGHLDSRGCVRRAACEG
jgi:hypothetical protein